MTKTSGLGDNFYVGGYDLSGDTASLDQISGGPALIDVTPINAFANVRIGGQRSGDLQFTTYFDAAAGGEHAALSTLPRTDVIATYARGTVIGNAAACIQSRQINYDPTRDNVGNLTLKVELQSDAYGMEWGTLLTAGLRTDTTATTGPSFDNTSAQTFGAQAYLQITSLTGTNVDVTISHATTSGGSYSTLIDFGSQTAIGAFRATAAGTVDEFLKVNTTGTFSSATFNVVIVVNKTAVVF
jgi:hypothetical protein